MPCRSLLALASPAILLMGCADLAGPSKVHMPGPDDGGSYTSPDLPALEYRLTIAGAGEYQLQVGDSVTLRAEVVQRLCSTCEFHPIDAVVGWELDGAGVAEIGATSDDAVTVQVTGEGTAVVRATFAGLVAEVRVTGAP